MRLPLALLMALLVLGAGAAPASADTGSPTTARASADDDDDDRGERRINRTTGRGLRACRTALRRTRGGTCVKVIEDVGDRERYEITIRRGVYRFEVDLSRTFRVLDVDRDRIGGDDDDQDDDDD